MSQKIYTYSRILLLLCEFPGSDIVESVRLELVSVKRLHFGQNPCCRESIAICLSECCMSFRGFAGCQGWRHSWEAADIRHLREDVELSAVRRLIGYITLMGTRWRFATRSGNVAQGHEDVCFRVILLSNDICRAPCVLVEAGVRAFIPWAWSYGEIAVQ
jgi:hypothetical protein